MARKEIYKTRQGEIKVEKKLYGDIISARYTQQECKYSLLLKTRVTHKAHYANYHFMAQLSAMVLWKAVHISQVNANTNNYNNLGNCLGPLHDL